MSDKESSDSQPRGDLKNEAPPTKPPQTSTSDSVPSSPKKTASTTEKKEESTKFTYRDYSQVEPTHAQPGPMSPNSSAIRVQKLPAKLNAMLANPEYQHIMSWMPHGRSWKVHNPHAFVTEVIPKYFEYTNYNSFVRLVNAWGFRRITKGPDRNSYYHELFLRGMPHLHSKMHRLTANEKKLPVDPEDEPDFYKISALCPLPPSPRHVASIPKPMGNIIRRDLLQEQMMANGLGSGAGMLGAGMVGGGYHHDLAAARMAGMNPMVAAQLEEERMAMAAAGVGQGMLNSTLSHQRAELLAANQAYELQAARLREQERRIAYLSGGLRYPGASMGRLGRGTAMLPDDMLSDPSGLGQMSPAMMAQLRESQEAKGPRRF